MSIYEYDEELHKKTPEQIAEELEEEDLEVVQHICDLAVLYAPDYEIHFVHYALPKNRQSS